MSLLTSCLGQHGFACGSFVCAIGCTTPKPGRQLARVDRSQVWRAYLQLANRSVLHRPCALQGMRLSLKCLCVRGCAGCWCCRTEREGFNGPGALSRSGQLNFLPVPRDAARGSGSVRRGISSSAANPLRASTGSFHTPPPKKAPSMAAMNVQPPRTSVKGHRSTAGAGEAAAAAMSWPAVGAADGPHTPAGATVADSQLDMATSGSSCKRESTSSKLDNIFKKTSVQHPVAKLDSAAMSVTSQAGDSRSVTAMVAVLDSSALL